MHGPSLKISSGTFFRHEGEGRMNWRTREYKIFSHLLTGIYQWNNVSNGSDDWVDENTSCPVGTECTIITEIHNIFVIFATNRNKQLIHYTMSPELTWFVMSYSYEGAPDVSGPSHFGT